jgi:geranylgeranyl diphosphate synthase, type I
MLSRFAPVRDQIAEVLKGFLAAKKKDLSCVSPLGADACERLLSFSLQGKMIRGCLVSTGYRIMAAPDAGTLPRSVREAGAAMELFQSGLLVHDDIMDRDLTRRGSATVFHQYAQEAERQGLADALHVGESLGTCVGDIAYFLAFELLAGMEAAPGAVSRITALCARELAAVGAAQMQDVAWGPSAESVGREEVLRLYAHKTGRYTFSLPLAAGGLLAGAPADALTAFGALGEHLGVVFQVRDDELNLFGDERETGKPVGSDIREGKKTLLAVELMARAGEEDARLLSGIIGNPAVSEAEILRVRALAERLGVRQAVQGIARDHGESARALIGALDGRPGTEELAGLLDYSLARTR